jgi:O-antigen/teichoic acid export membrane protein
MAFVSAQSIDTTIPLDPKRSLSEGIVWVYLSLMAQAVTKFLVVVLLTRLLSPADFGLVGIALIFTSVAERFGTIGVGPSVVQILRLSSDDRRTAEVLSVFSGVLITVVLWVAAPFVAAFFNQPDVSLVLQVLACGFLLDGFGVVPDAILQRHLQFRTLMVIENAASIGGQLLVGVIAAWNGLGVWSLVAANLAFRVLKLGGVVMYAPLGPGGGVFNRESAVRLIDRGVGFSLGRILNFFSLQGDNFIVGRILGIEALGMYTRAYQLMSLPAMYVGQVVDRVLFPAVAQLQGDMQKVRRSLLGSIEVVSVVSLPIAVGLFIASSDVIRALFGERWMHIVPVLSVLSLGVFFRTAYKCADTLVKSLGAVYRHAFRQALYTTLVLGGSLLGARVAGLTGVAWGVVLAVATHYVVITELAVRMTGVQWSAIARAHLPGLWVSVWVAVGLVGLHSVPLFQATEGATVRLAADIIVSLGAAWLGYMSRFGAFRGEVVTGLVQRVRGALSLFRKRI